MADRIDLKSVRLSDIAEWTGGRLEGDGSVPVRRPAPLGSARSDELGLVAEARYAAQVADSAAGSLLVAESVAESLDDDRPRVVVPDARAALVPVLLRLDPTPRPEPGVHPTAVLGQGVTLGERVSIGPYAVLDEGVVVGDGTVVGAHCVIGSGSVLGEDCYLHPHVVIYANTVLGDRVQAHAGARLGSDGFGYVVHEGAYRKVPQVGGCELGDDVEVGANTCVDRGSIGDTSVGAGSKLDNLVHLAHNVRLGANSALAAMTGIAGSTDIGPWAQFGGQSGAVGHLSIGTNVRVGAQAGILADLPDDAEVTGFPARDLKGQLKGYAAIARLPDLMRRVRALERELKALQASLDGTEG